MISINVTKCSLTLQVTRNWIDLESSLDQVKKTDEKVNLFKF